MKRLKKCSFCKNFGNSDETVHLLPFQPISLNYFSLLHVFNLLHVWWPPQTVELCHSSKLTRKYVLVSQQKESSCCSSKLTQSIEPQNKVRISCVETPQIKIEIRNFQKRLKRSKNWNQSIEFNNLLLIAHKQMSIPYNLLG